ncbi:2-hydroxyacid dehydrogenase [Lacisediminimonas profundi]|uniref:2-hydroxyacid dehydrogenase n=1 Tax=Lacisediminimonas profundi TaxID=2603856 RepID=UPI00124B9F4F|nr:2-hydroxyacid dehydrogenase [Lacisediminimonas profundi]
MKPEIALISPIHATGMVELNEQYIVHRVWEAPDPKAFLASIADRIEVAVTSGLRGAKAWEMDALPRLKLLASFGVGYDGIDIAAAKQRGIIVTNTPDVLNECVADTTWTLILSTVRRTVFNDRYVRAGRWLSGPAPLSDKVWGENIGIVGLGRIGRAIARRATGFGMQIGYHGRSEQKDVPYRYFADAAELARWAKILVVACPGGKGTEKIIDERVLQALGSDSYLINISRGSTIDEPALIRALQAGTIAGAGLDVFVDEPRVPEALCQLDNVVLQPHVGSGTHATRAAMAKLVTDNVAAWFAGRPLLSPV